MDRRQLLLGLGSGLGIAAVGRPARATTALAVGLPELVGRSQHALVAQATGHWSRWETVGRSRRIVTYVTTQVLHPIDGRQMPDETLVLRTLGGRVGDFGQLVHGAPKLRTGEESVLFLRPDVDGVLSVTAMAQGHYPLKIDERSELRLVPSAQVPHLLNPRTSAVRALSHRTVLEAEALVCEHTLTP